MSDKKQSESVASSAVPQLQDVCQNCSRTYGQHAASPCNEPNPRGWKWSESACPVGDAPFSDSKIFTAVPQPERPWSECPRCDDGLYNGKECAVCWGTGRVTERLVTHICGKPERPKCCPRCGSDRQSHRQWYLNETGRYPCPNSWHDPADAAAPKETP